MRILVTGAAGFIGRHIVAALGAAGHRVVCAARDVERMRRMFPDQESFACDFNRDVTIDAWLPRMARIDAVVNCAGILQSRPGQSLPVVWLQIKMRDLAAAAVAIGAPLTARYRRYARIWFGLGWPAFTAIIFIVYLMVAKP